MNLELLAPRQIPDRVDSTLQLPSSSSSGGGEGLVPSFSSSSTSPNNNNNNNSNTGSSSNNNNSKAANHVSFNRRGSYIAVGYGNGTLAVYDMLSRTLSGLYYYHNNSSSSSSPSSSSTSSLLSSTTNHGINLISWSRRSRTMLAGSVGCKEVWLIDATHPYGSECAIINTTTIDNNNNNNNGGGGGGGGGTTTSTTASTTASSDQQQQKDTNIKDEDKDNPQQQQSSSPSSSFLNPAGSRNDFVRRPGKLQTIHLPPSASASSKKKKKKTTGSAAEETSSSSPPPIRKKRERQTLVGASSLFSSSAQSSSSSSSTTTTTAPASSSRRGRFPWVQFELPTAVGVGGVGVGTGAGAGSSTLQIHPRDNCSGLSVLHDGSIIAFRVPVDSFNTDNSKNAQEGDCGDPSRMDETEGTGGGTARAARGGGVVLCATIYQSDEHFVTCSAWDTTRHSSHKKNNNSSSHHNDDEEERLYATTRDGKLLGFDVSSIYDALAMAEEKWKQQQQQQSSSSSTPLEVDAIAMVEPNFVISIPGGAETWQVTVNRSGSHLVVNSADAALRTYDTKECWVTAATTKDNIVVEDDDDDDNIKPKFVFQDVVSKVKFVSCDFSSDGEYLVGCANSGEASRYELYIWNTETGALMDKLSGASVEASSVAFHPTRSFIAVATSDGLVDVWGHKMSWTQFAPDFQALPTNVEYVECEDEFDSVVVANSKENTGDTSNTNGDGNDTDLADPTMETEAVTMNDRQNYDDGQDDDDDNEEEKEPVDVISIEPVTVFQSDSEDEEDVFYFETRIVKPPPPQAAGSN